MMHDFALNDERWLDLLFPAFQGVVSPAMYNGSLSVKCINYWTSDSV